MKTRRDAGLRKTLSSIWGKLPRVLTAIVIAASMVTPGMAPPVEAAGQTRTLKIYFIHTQEKAQITFKRNGRYDPKGLQQVNMMLRDWRRNEPTKMDPRLLDLIWEVYQKSGSRDYIHVVSGYRSPATNGMLRSRTKGVAKKSQHMLGKAMDFYLPDVKLKTLREIGMKFQVGGVGYYPTSGSPFVHMDVGGVRAWPRMSRSELVRLFPDGKTMHLPSDGSPLPGYEQAVADYKRRVGADAIQVAGGGYSGPGDKATKRPGKTLMAMLFGGGDEDEDASAIASGGGSDSDDSEAPATAQRGKATPPPANTPVLAGVEGADETPVRETAVAAAEETVKAPVPLVRPAFQDLPAESGVQTALVAPPRNAAQDALAAATPQAAAQEEFADLARMKVPVPQARVTELQAGAALADAAEAAEEGEALAFVPVPALRPAGAEALAAVAAAEVAQPEEGTSPAVSAPAVVAMADAGSEPLAAAKATPVFAPRPAEEVKTATTPLASQPAPAAQAERDVAALTPAQTRALASVVPPANPSNEARAKVALASPSQDPVEMAAYAPDPMEGKRDIFRSAFDMPPEAPKAGRPKKQQAEAAQRVSKRTAPKLTQKIIAEWALTTGRMAQLSRPVKAPRFVSPALRASPTTVYSAGFSSAPATVDTARFSGTAVNFMEVKRFSNGG
ncbi:DUF882 domain-containing protein [Rhizobium sp. YIM 134829]|uniref:DUF882 domain-containing protein n=1 Tax=Rhizobium sp. YIM 134829 TaxID=3390453 RepID=UPI00397D8C23